MKIKPLPVTAACLILCLAGLCITAFLAQRDNDLFLVLPAKLGSPRFDVEKIEELGENEFPLTYEISGSERVILSHAQFPVTAIATNSSYPQILDLRMIEGSFFTKQAWKEKQRHAVLNEKAAFTVFGSNKIAGNRFSIRNASTGSAETWIVTGVINDGDDDTSRIYIPSSIRGGEAGALALANASAGELGDAYVIASIKTLGIRDGDFHYINLGTFSALLWERAGVILLLFLAILCLSLMRPLYAGFKKTWSVLKEELRRQYIGEILSKNTKSILKPALFILCLFAFPALALFLFLNIASVCLPWQDISSLSPFGRDFFHAYIARLRSLELASRVLFGLSLAVMTAFFIAFYNRK